jgi:hypothetical protein
MIARFDFPKRLGAPWIIFLILHQLGFGVVTIIDINPNATQIGDIVVELMHNSFALAHKFGLKCDME